MIDKLYQRRVAAYYTKANYRKNGIWLIFLVVVLALSIYKLSQALNPVSGSLIVFVLSTLALLFMCVRASIRVFLIRRGISKGSA